jgi:hypothetical protein
MRLIEIDGLDPEPPQARLQRPGQPDPRQADVVGAVAGGERPLVAITIRSRPPDLAASQRPMIVSDSPSA